MVNFINSAECEFIFCDSFLENRQLQNLIMLSNEPYINMDLNDKLITSLSHEVTGDMLIHIRELLKKGADPNAIDPDGTRPIHLAIMKSPCNCELVLELIRHGADLNVINLNGYTPLAFAVEKRCHKTIETLIKKGSNVNFQCYLRGWSPLMLSAMIGDLRTARTLLRHGANVNACDVLNKTALMFAVEGNYQMVIKELLDYGANAAKRCNGNRTALGIYLKKSYPNLNVINELLLHCAPIAGLFEDAQTSFSKIMKVCFRNKPPYHPCVRTVVKIQMLSTWDHRSAAEFEDFYDFSVECCSEIRYMERYSVNKLSGGIATTLRRCLEGWLPKEKELEGLLPYVANNYFPVYSDILRALLRKSFLRKKFMSMLIYAKVEDKKDAIFLNSDIVLMLMGYLSDNDIANFVLAAYLKKKLEKKTSYGSLYPQGLYCNMNDVMNST